MNNIQNLINLIKKEGYGVFSELAVKLEVSESDLALLIIQNAEIFDIDKSTDGEVIYIYLN